MSTTPASTSDDAPVTVEQLIESRRGVYEFLNSPEFWVKSDLHFALVRSASEHVRLAYISECDARRDGASS